MNAKAASPFSSLTAAGDSSSKGAGGTLSGLIIDQVRSALFAGMLTPGERLGTEVSLAEQFGVSRMAIRDALRSLEAVGIIEIRVGLRGGVYVAGGDVARLPDLLAIQFKLLGVQAEEMIDAQIAIEVVASGLAAEKATAEEIAGLWSRIEQMEKKIAEPADFTSVALEFHMAVVDASHNRVLSGQFRALRHLLLPLYARGTTTSVAERAIAANRALVACIEARDPSAARSVLGNRLQLIKARQNMREPVDRNK
jgi:GntR family transcriptional repressor for pyruvate dehydrogenase complex